MSSTCLILLCILLLGAQRTTANDQIASPNTTRPETADEDFPHETQSAQCTITAGEVQASAQATISKKLEGVCGSKQLAKSFEILEARLMNELYQIRSILAQLAVGPNRHLIPNQQPYGPHMQPFFYQPPPPNDYMRMVPVQHHRPMETVTASPPQPMQTTSPSPTVAHSVSVEPSTLSVQNSTEPTTPKITEPLREPETEEYDDEPDKPITRPVVNLQPKSENQTTRTILFKPVQTKSLKSPQKNATKKKTLPRELEVAKFNNTVLSGNDIRIFSYYWRIDNFQMKLKSNVSVIYSPVFSISGLHLKIKAVLNHLNRDYLYLQLESVPSENLVDDSNVVLESGTLFQEIETKKLFKHKITILDQETPTSDLVSQEFLNTNSGFPVPNSAIVSGPYAKDSNILIKVLIFV